ncbi:MULTISPECIES: hypothetical protein [unclassified Dyella]|uniref:hypothetical protein n=1 Tax=unclassified Dyella TaxID=2634549 RepID=UPI0018EB1BBA|nr:MULTISPECIES: hypothetical protein [unclassified Dyella]MDR3445766.1 hypothetical protein [Dyella sp.]
MILCSSRAVAAYRNTGFGRNWIPACAGMTIKSKRFVLAVIPAQAGIQLKQRRVKISPLGILAFNQP